MSLDPQNRKPQNSVRRDDRNHDPYPLANSICRVLVCFQNRRAADLAFRLQVGGIHAVVFGRRGG